MEIVLVQPIPIAQAINNKLLHSHGYWLSTFCAVTNFVLNVCSKAFYFSRDPSKSATFSLILWYRIVFSWIPLSSLTFITMGHVSTGSSGQSGSYKARFTSAFGSSVSAGSFHSFTCHNPKSWRKMHWRDSSPSYGCLRSFATAISSVLYHASDMEGIPQEGNRGRGIHHRH